MPLVRTLLIFVGVLCTFISPVFSLDGTVAISFEQLPVFAIRNSPEVKRIEQASDLEIAEGKVDLQPSNPTVSYSQEFVQNDSDEGSEHFLTLNKQFEMPWVYKLRRQSWDSRLEAAKYGAERELRTFFSSIKADYVEIKLIEEQRKKLDVLKRIITKMANVAESQYEERYISGIEKNLIKMSLSNLDSRSIRLEQEMNFLISEWKTKIGIKENEGVQLPTDIDFKPVEAKSIDAYLSMVSGSPGFLQRNKQIDAAEKRVEMEEFSLFPYLNLFGGYKRVSPDFNGFIVGVSLPIPILNSNEAQIEKEQTELIQARNELFSYKLKLRNQIEAKLKAIDTYRDSLKEMSGQFESSKDLIDKAVFSYEEGHMSLTELLSAIQIYAENQEQYYKQLTNYYRNIFELEAIIPEQLVTFSN